MRPKKYFKLLFYLFLLIFGAYLVFVFAYGGFGKKSPVHISSDKEVLLFAHRGISLYYPENSLEGIKAAKQHGFRAAEVDIRRSADRHMVIFHDENCARLLGIDQEVDSLNLEDLKKNPILLSNGQKSTSFVPTVEELLRSERDSMIFYFDMKFSSFKDADESVALIEKYHCEKSVILTNWNIFFIFYVEAKYPEIITGLEGFDTGKEWTYALMPRDLKPDYLSGFYSHSSKEHVDWLRKNELLESRIVYGVDSSNYVQALRSGFRNILLDYDSSMNKDPEITALLPN